MRSDIAQGEGMFRSADGGRTWAAAGLKDSQQIGRILVDPRDPNGCWSPPSAIPTAANTRARRVPLDRRRRELDAHPVHATPTPARSTWRSSRAIRRLVYAALWQTRRPPWNVYPPSSGPGSGLYKLARWRRAAGRRAQVRRPARLAWAGSASRSRRRAPTALRPDRRQAGRRPLSLRRRGRELAQGQRATSASGSAAGTSASVTVNPANADELWVCDTVVLHSTDGGRTFVPQKGDPTGDDFHQLWIDPRDPNAPHPGLRPGDAGDASTAARPGAAGTTSRPASSITSAPTTAFPTASMARSRTAARRASPAAPTRSGTASTSTHFREQTAGGESDNIAPDPDDPDIIFGGRVDRLDLRTGQIRSVDPTLAWPARRDPTAPPGPCRWCSARWTKPSTSPTSASFARPRRRRPLGADQPRPHPRDPGRAGDARCRARSPTTSMRGRARAWSTPSGPRRGTRATSGSAPTTAWSGAPATAARHWAGRHARRARPPGRRSAWSSRRASIRTAPTIAVDRHRLDDPAPHILRTRDGGRQLDADHRWSGDRDAAQLGKRGARGQGAPRAAVRRNRARRLRLARRRRPLVAAQARACPSTSRARHGPCTATTWSSPPTAAASTSSTTSSRCASWRPARRPERSLFAPAAAVRFRPRGVHRHAACPRTSRWPPIRLRRGDRLPAGRATAKPVEIAILDDAGALVRRYSSAEPATGAGSRQDRHRAGMAPAPPPPSGHHGWRPSPGVGRCATLPKASRDEELRSAASSLRRAATPSRSPSTARPCASRLSVVPDPRVTAPPAAYQAEFDLARAIEADRLRSGGDDQGGADADKAPPALAALAERLRELQLAVDGADGAPSAGRGRPGSPRRMPTEGAGWVPSAARPAEGHA